MVHILKHGDFRVDLFQQRFTEGVKRRHGHVSAAFAARFHHARFHFPRSFLRVRETQNVFPTEGRIGVQQVADPLGDHPRFPGAGSGDHQQGPLPMRNGAPLRVIHLYSAVIQWRIQIEQREIHATRLADFKANRKRRGIV